MLSYEEIILRIEKIEELYNNSDDIQAQLYAKLALMEVGGWVEEFVDDELHKYDDKMGGNRDNRTEKHINGNYQFSYNAIGDLIAYHIGIYKFLQIETAIGERDVSRLRSELGMLKESRDELAHTSTSLNQAILAPNALLARFKIVVPILQKYFAELNKIV